MTEEGNLISSFTVETLCKRATSMAHLTNFSFECFYALFTEDAFQRFLNFYTMVQNIQK